MCGFVGTTNTHNVELMLSKQEFRGPDGSKFWKDKEFAIGHCLLDINGKRQFQPIETSNGNIIAFNGEMYDSTIQNDTMWLANMYETYGRKVLEWSDWHGSIIHYNPKSGDVTLVRDHFGAKPLWYYKKGKDIEVSTSLRSFLRKESDRRKWHIHMKTKQWFGRDTQWNYIHKVAPGEVVTLNIKKGTIRIENLWRYYNIESHDLHLPEFRDKLIESINKVAKNIQKTGLFLSGGFDSTMAFSAVKDSDLDLHIYSCKYDKQLGRQWDHEGFRREFGKAKHTCIEFGYDVNEVMTYPNKRYMNHMHWIEKTHYLWADKNRTSPRYEMCKQASADGCKVILTGDSADELVSGYKHHEKRFNDEYNLETMEHVKRTHKWFPTKSFGDDLINNTLFHDLLTTSEQNILTTDQTCGMFGMESRPVFLTQSFVKYIMSVKGTDKLKDNPDYHPGEWKWLLREGMKDYIPEHVRLRAQKIGWSSPWDNNNDKIRKREQIEQLKYLEEMCK